MKASENSPTLGIISRSSKDAVLAEILELREAENPNGEAVDISGWPNGCDTYCRSKAPKKQKNNTQMFIVYGKYKNCTSKNLFGLLPKGSSFLKKWMFKSMNLNSIIWSQSYNWGGMCKITNEHPCHPKKVRQWCQNKTKTSYPHPPRKTNIKTP